jgi:hypothetical protein
MRPWIRQKSVVSFAVRSLLNEKSLLPKEQAGGKRMFDPEKVKRFDDDEVFLLEPSAVPDTHWVRASDYDELLALYREFVPAIPCYICGNEAKESKAHVVGSKESVCMKCWDAA